MNSTSAVIGIDIGGTKTLGGIVSLQGQILHRQQVPTPIQDGARSIIDCIVTMCRSLLSMAEQSHLQIKAIGIGTAGQVNTDHGIISYANENLPGWANMPVRETIGKAFGIPIAIDNDVNALAVGECRFGAGQGYKDLLLITVGTGIGGAIVFDGSIWHGSHFSAGEIGYMLAGWQSDKPVSVESVASGPGIAANFRRITNRDLTLHAIAELARNNDETAIQVIQTGARKLGYVLGPLLVFLDPQVLIVGGGVPEIGDLWWQPFMTAIRSLKLPAAKAIDIVPARFHTEGVMLGAAALAIDVLN